jgi:hypothetical protein
LGMRIKSASEKKFQTEHWPISLAIAYVTVTGGARSFDEIRQEAAGQMNSVNMQSHTRWGDYTAALPQG